MGWLAAHFPFRPARLPVFYGWVVVALATLGMLASIPGQTMGVSVFTDPLIEATGLSRLELSTAYLVGTLASSLFLPRGGLFLDRHGSRATALVACIALALTLCAFSQIDALIALVARPAEAAAPAWLATGVLAIAFLAVRFSGQGLLTLASRTMLMKWFDRRRGLAAGISSVFVAFGFAAAPPGLKAAVDALGWRGAWLALAAVIGLGIALLVWIFFRDDPEGCGLRMDGRPAPEPTGERTPEEATGNEEEPSATRSEALRTAAFWGVTLATSLHAMVYTGVTFHILDLGRETGVSETAAVAIFLPIAAISTSVGLASGWASDRLPIRGLLVVFVVAQGLGYACVGSLGDPFLAAAGILGWGTASGLFTTITTIALPRFFGREHLGAITSVQMSAMVAGSAAGPALLAVSEDALGAYRTGLLGCCGLAVGVLVLVICVPLPGRRR